ncbi:minor head protein [Alteromonas phage vB_AmaS-R9Y1]|nr:minor head protein [Alteromonas phage vB_AmaS-R9Y1]
MELEILDDTIRRELALQRFASFLVRQYIRPTAQELALEIPRALAGYEDLPRAEQFKVFAKLKRLVRERWKAMWDPITGQLGDVAIQELEYMADLYDDVIAGVRNPGGRVVVPEMVLGDGNLIRAGKWAEFIAGNADETAQRIDGRIKRMWRDGGTLNDILYQLRGKYNRRTKAYEGGIIEGQVKKATTLARTGVSHYTAAARDKFANANREYISDRIFFATLDGSTTDICLGNHLNRYPITSDEYPRLPLHYNERSVYIFAGKGFDPLDGDRPSKGANGSEEISAKTTAAAWLKRQPREWVERQLGKTRAALFLDGGLPLNKFLDAANVPLTLEQLAETIPGQRAFRRANLGL